MELRGYAGSICTRTSTLVLELHVGHGGGGQLSKTASVVISRKSITHHSRTHSRGGEWVDVIVAGRQRIAC